MSQADRYLDLYGSEISLASLDAEERKLVGRLKRRATAEPPWHEFGNFYVKQVGDFYQARGLKRTQVTRTPAWRIAQDLSGRLAVAQGIAKIGDYRDTLEHIILTRFKNRRAFCKKTGLSETMLSHVLARRKHISIDALEKAMRRIGFRFSIGESPKAESKPHNRRAAG
jgi:hypothetical protein